MSDIIEELNANVFKNELETLLVKSANLLEREWPVRYARVPNAHAVFFSRMRLTINTYNAFLRLTADVPPDPLRKPLLFAVSPLVRSLFEELATLLFFLHDVPNLLVSYTATGYTELWLEKQASQKYYGTIPKWQTYIADLDARMKQLASDLSLTPAQTSNPLQGIKRWPTPGRKMLTILRTRYPSSPVIQFMEFLNAWMYRTLSGDSHLNFISLQLKGLHFTPQFAKHVLDDDHKEELEERRIRYHKDMTWAAFSVLLSIVSEIEAHFGYGMKHDARYLWIIFEAHSEMAKDFYDMRYKQLLS